MADDNERIEQLLARLDQLLKRQDSFQAEINGLRDEINALRQGRIIEKPPVEDIKQSVIQPPPIPLVTTPVPAFEHVIQPVQEEKKPAFKPFSTKKEHKPLIAKEDWEKFIGENLINKIGIIILVLGVGIGTKYFIDIGLITPLVRIVLGYVVGAGLIGFAMRLKKNYESYSAVLLSGAMAIMYFVSFAAYSFYALIPVELTFGLMVLFTIFTVVAAIQYNKQVIALIGLVGAYAVPFLLSDGSGRVVIMFSYMVIINTGILVLAFRKYWKLLFYTSFGLTWLIYLAWYVDQYNHHPDIKLAFTFLSIFFGTFYVMLMAYKLIRKEKFVVEDVILILFNSFLFYGVGYLLLDAHPVGKQLLGVFTLVNAIIHFVVCAFVYKRELGDRNLFYLVSGLVLLFITIAVPVQLDGHWVTLVWAGESALLFWLGRTKKVSFYEYLSYPLVALAFFSLLQDWSTGYNLSDSENPHFHLTPVLNIQFLSSLLVVAALSFIMYLNTARKYITEGKPLREMTTIFGYMLSLMLLIVSYCSVFMEISTYWQQLYNASAFKMRDELGGFTQYDSNLHRFQAIWLINYTLVFVSLLTLFNIKAVKNKALGIVTLVLSGLAMAIFLVAGLLFISELRDSYLSQSLAQYYDRGIFHIWIRYISYAFAGLLLYTAYLNTREDAPAGSKLKMPFELAMHLVFLWIASSELINVMNLLRMDNTYKLQLSILWGCYALLLIVLGIWKKKQHLRIAAMVLFAVTLLKLFVYDISHLGVIALTIAFVSLGILLLIISFLYNKYKHVISGEDKQV